MFPSRFGLKSALLRGSAKGALLLALAVTVSGCSTEPQSIGDVVDAYPTDQAREISNGSSPMDGPWAFVVDGELLVTLGGSSSCPPVPIEAVAKSDESNLTVVIDSNRTGPCTADMSSVTYRIPVEAVPETVTFDFYGEQELTVNVAQQ